MRRSMNRVCRGLVAGLALMVVPLFSVGSSAAAQSGERAIDPLAWPAASEQCRPWTRWWWLGSAVDKENLTSLLEQYQAAGLGGVEICPIYGAKGYENQFIDFLSPKWVEMLGHTTAEAKRIGLGVDMTTGTGWPFGGPDVSMDDASSKVVLKRFDVPGGSAFKGPLPEGRLQCLQAVSGTGQTVDLAPRVKDGRLDWTAPAGAWRVYAVVEVGPVQRVKRAAPGGAGSVLDPFSVKAMTDYLGRFDRAFMSYRGDMPRCQFHDSYEYFAADWTPDLFTEFQARRGYDLRSHIPALFGEGSEETVARVKCDYRETLSDLHLAYLSRWTEWAHAHGCLTRNQAHGGPGNLIDAYAVSDIPETEIYSRYAESYLPMLKLSSSAAHLKGSTLASSESFTWLGQHFQVALSEVKPAADFLLLSGVNHIFFHGIPYSSKDAPWPGWQFYAAVNFGPEGGLWHDLPAFNRYVTRCQSVLQPGRPANDVLLYLPFHDIWQSPDGLVKQFTTAGEWMKGYPFYDAATLLWEHGYGYDEVSDRFIAQAKCENGKIVLGGNAYSTLVLPGVRLLPFETLARVDDLAAAGATIVILGNPPGDVPGFLDFEKRRDALKQLAGASRTKGGSPLSELPVGKGRLLFGDDLNELLTRAGLKREMMADAGLQFIRRTHEKGYHYFIVNRGEKPVDAWVALGTPAQSAVLMDPMFEDRTGAAALRQAKDGSIQVYLQLQPLESRILRTFTDANASGPRWPYTQPAGQPVALTGNWKVQFIEGGPELPKPYETAALASWTARDDPELKRFAGTARYVLEFDRPSAQADEWVIDLGKVCESARVTLNDAPLGTLFAAPFRVPVGSHLRPGRNVLAVEVTNLAANRIADMDRRGVRWKYFYDANVANLKGKGVLDASAWPLRDSGLLGPVTLHPLKILQNPDPPTR